MSEDHHSSEDFALFKDQYGETLAKFLRDQTTSEDNLNKGYELGRQAVSKHLGILSLAAIHYNNLENFLENLETDNQLEIADKATIFLEEVLSPFHMIGNNFLDAIHLLNKRSVRFAIRVKELQGSIKEKEYLLKEIYHRVKNNLQVVTSLLNLQVENTENDLARKVLIESSARIKSMALIHEMLYQSSNLSEINMGEYLHNLLKYLYEIYDVDTDRIKFSMTVDCTILGIDLAIPCGLIVNELISNSFKHAFPNGKAGEIKLSLENHDGKVNLVFADNGIGIPSKVDIQNIPTQNIPTLGMQLIQNLTKQINGHIMLQNDKGTHFSLTFSL